MFDPITPRLTCSVAGAIELAKVQYTVFCAKHKLYDDCSGFEGASPAQNG